MKNFIITGIIFLPTVLHFILYLFKKYQTSLALTGLGVMFIAGLFLKFFFVPQYVYEIGVAINLVLGFGLFFLKPCIYVRKRNVSEKYLKWASPAYIVASVFILLGYSSLSGIIFLRVSGPVYFVIGFISLHFLFLWRLRFLEINAYMQGSTIALVLSADEEKLLWLLLEGKTDKEISEQFYKSEPTIKKYLRGLYQKLGVKNRMEAARFYQKEISKRKRGQSSD